MNTMLFLHSHISYVDKYIKICIMLYTHTHTHTHTHSLIFPGETKEA